MATSDNAKTPAKIGKSQAQSYDLAKSDETLDLAKDLAKFIKDNKLSTQVQGKEFVNVEGWQYAGSRLGIVPVVEHLLNVSTDQELKYQAKVTLFDMRSQHTVGAGFAICSNKESGRKFYQEFAIASMAQTRAIGKAYRNILAWIIRAAGYEPTPAEEMEYTGNVPTPIVAQGPAEQMVPVMRVAPEQAEAAPVQYATASQKEEIIRLLDHPLITRQEKSKMLININRLDEERANQAIAKLKQAIEDREGQGNESAGAPSVTPAASNSDAPVASTGSGQSSEAQVEAVKNGATLSLETERGEPHLVARYPSGSADPEASYSTPHIAECARRLCSATSSLDVTDIWNKLTGGERKELRVEKESALARIQNSVKEVAAKVLRQQPAQMKDAGTDSVLVDEFIQQPVIGTLEHPEFATDEQKVCIQRLLDHPTVTRKEKTKLLLVINKLDKERARLAIIKLRKAIGDREGIDPIESARASVKAFVLRNEGKLSQQQNGELTSLAASQEVMLEFLLDALDLAQQALIDDETYGTANELAEVEAATDSQLAA
jgi:hypothetical protein